MKSNLDHKLLATVLIAALPLIAEAAEIKDIVLDRVAAPAVSAAGAAAPAAQPTRSDAMAISVLVESPNGSLTPKSVNSVFSTGDRFRVKLLAARPGKVALYNTNALGVFKPEPIWRGTVVMGQESITPRLRLEGTSGADYLHVVLEPEQAPQGVIAWINSWLSKEGDSAAPKDIRLDSESTPTATYLVNQSGQGLVSTIRIVHR